MATAKSTYLFGGDQLRAPEFVAFQNDRSHWQVIDDVADVGDDVAILRVGDDTLPHLVGCRPHRQHLLV